jgi:hypothetical protein
MVSHAVGICASGVPERQSHVRGERLGDIRNAGRDTSNVAREIDYTGPGGPGR